MTDLDEFARVASGDRYLCIVATLRADTSIQTSLVNGGVLVHPVTGTPVVGFVAGGGTRKLANLRARPRATVVARAGWEWVAVEGRTELIGPDDPFPDMDAEGRRVLLRSVFAAAGGTHDDWEAYDAVMLRERRVVVLVTPDRVYSNG